MVRDAYGALECSDYYGSFVTLKDYSFNAMRLRFQNLNIMHQNVLEAVSDTLYWILLLY